MELVYVNFQQSCCAGRNGTAGDVKPVVSVEMSARFPVLSLFASSRSPRASNEFEGMAADEKQRQIPADSFAHFKPCFSSLAKGCAFGSLRFVFFPKLSSFPLVDA